MQSFVIGSIHSRSTCAFLKGLCGTFVAQLNKTFLSFSSFNLLSFVAVNILTILNAHKAHSLYEITCKLAFTPK